MTEHFVTIFDSAYLLRGLALYRSLQRHCEDFKLWVVGADEETVRALRSLNLGHVTVLGLSNYETEENLRVKGGRSRAEYLWTLTPQTFRWVFSEDSDVSRVTYVDADMWLLREPNDFFDAFQSSGAAVSITEHAYHPAFDMSSTSGRFCVQFLTAVRGRSDYIITEWERQCLDWCFARFEDGKFGDQGYLNDWPARYESDVFIPLQQELFQGPWNAQRFPPEKALTYHFHSYLLFRGYSANVGGYPIPKRHRTNIYTPYLKDLRAAGDLLEQVTGFALRFDRKSISFRKTVGRVKASWKLRLNFFK